MGGSFASSSVSPLSQSFVNLSVNFIDDDDSIN